MVDVGDVGSHEYMYKSYYYQSRMNQEKMYQLD